MLNRVEPWPRPIVCVVTRVRGAVGSTEREALLSRLAQAATAGASMIQIRERQIDDRSLLAFTRELVTATRGTGSAVLVNDRLDVALAAGAAGVHLKSNGPAVEDVRRVAPSNFLVGRSIHSLAEAVATESSGGCDYLLFGTVFPSLSKPSDHPVAGTAALAQVCAAVSLPVLAIGGVTPSRAADVAAAGAAGVAGIGYFADSRDLAAAVAALRGALTDRRGRV